MSNAMQGDSKQHGIVGIESPEPYTVGDPGRAYTELGGGVPFRSMMPPDSMCDAFDCFGWSIRAASARGLMHRSDGSPRQDAYAVRYSSDTDRFAVAVCDGVGSAPQSHVAAEAAANRLVDRAMDGAMSCDDEWWTETFQVASEAVTVAAQTLGVSDASAAGVREVMATTAILVVVDKVSGSGSWTVRYAGIGDSSLWLTDVSTDDDTAWIPVLGGKAAAEDVATNRTSALPLRDGTPVRPGQFTLLEGQLLLACTDGVGDAFGAGDGEVARALKQSWMKPPSGLNFAAQVSFGRRRLLDDRTGVALWTPVR